MPDWSNSVSDIQDYFEYILKKHGEKTFKPSIKICINKIENRITLSILSWTFNSWNNELLGSTKSKITKDKHGENVPYLEIIEVVIIVVNKIQESC